MKGFAMQIWNSVFLRRQFLLDQLIDSIQSQGFILGGKLGTDPKLYLEKQMAKKVKTLSEMKGGSLTLLDIKNYYKRLIKTRIDK